MWFFGKYRYVYINMIDVIVLKNEEVNLSNNVIFIRIVIFCFINGEYYFINVI